MILEKNPVFYCLLLVVSLYLALKACDLKLDLVCSSDEIVSNFFSSFSMISQGRLSRTDNR